MTDFAKMRTVKKINSSNNNNNQFHPATWEQYFGWKITKIKQTICWLFTEHQREARGGGGERRKLEIAKMACQKRPMQFVKPPLLPRNPLA